MRAIVDMHGRHDIHFGIVGGGTSLEELKALAAKLDVEDYVTFTGRVPDGMHASRMSKTLKRIFDDPEAGFGPLPAVKVDAPAAARARVTARPAPPAPARDRREA